jgi:hypothetical protein
MINLTLQVMRSFHHRRWPVLLGPSSGLTPAYDNRTLAGLRWKSLVADDFIFDSIASRGRLDNLAYLAAPKRRMAISSVASRNGAAIPRHAMRLAHLS